MWMSNLRGWPLVTISGMPPPGRDGSCARIHWMMARNFIAAAALPAILWAVPAFAAEPAAGLPIREIRIHGLRYTREALVRNQPTSRVGEPYSRETAARDHERLDRLAVFSSIAIEPEAAGGAVVVHVRVTETSRWALVPTLSAVGENGISIGAGIKTAGALGRAISASLNTRFGGQQKLGFLLDSPWGLRDKTWFGGEINALSRTNELDRFPEKALEGEARGGFQFGPSLRLGGRFEFLTVRSGLPEATLSGKRTESTPGLGLIAAYDTRDLWSDTHRGWQNVLTFTRYGGFLGGPGDFSKTMVDIRRYQPLAKKHTLAVFSFSTFQSGEVGVDIPVYRDFHLGGTNSIRGWSDLNARAGKNQLINTVEYRYDLVKPKPFRIFGANLYTGLKLAVFGDIGAVWNESAQFSRNFIGGVGVGLRLIVPFIQMIRVDLAFGERGEGLIPHFGLREKAFHHPRRVR